MRSEALFTAREIKVSGGSMRAASLSRTAKRCRCLATSPSDIEMLGCDPAQLDVPFDPNWFKCKKYLTLPEPSPLSIQDFLQFHPSH
jgi:hypothetical protein